VFMHFVLRNIAQFKRHFPACPKYFGRRSSDFFFYCDRQLGHLHWCYQRASISGGSIWWHCGLDISPYPDFAKHCICCFYRSDRYWRLYSHGVGWLWTIVYHRSNKRFYHLHLFAPLFSRYHNHLRIWQHLGCRRQLSFSVSQLVV
jgi:hypothetical protein